MIKITAATVVKYDVKLPGFAGGSATGVQNGYTLDTGLGGDVVFVATATVTDDINITVTSQSNGIVTLGLYAGGVAIAADTIISWMAFLKKGDETVSNDTREQTSIPNVMWGTSSLDDGGTIKPFRTRDDAVVFLANATTADTVVGITSQTGGTVTLSVKTAAAAASSETVHWVAFSTHGSAELSDGTAQTIVPGMTCGMSEKQDAETIDTKLGYTVAFLAQAEVADTVVVATSQSNGVVTIAMDVAGVATAADETVHWVAFHGVYK